MTRLLSAIGAVFFWWIVVHLYNLASGVSYFTAAGIAMLLPLFLMLVASASICTIRVFVK